MSRNIELEDLIKAMEENGISEAVAVSIKEKLLKKPEEKKKVFKGKPAEEYVLKSIVKCSLCKTKTTHSFLMKRREDNPSVLQAVPLKGDCSLRVETRIAIWATCSHCEEVLLSLDKSVLVEKLLTIKNKEWKK